MRIVFSSLVLAVLIAACGYKGPLYLPKDKPEAQPRAPAPTQEPKKDSKESQ